MKKTVTCALAAIMLAVSGCSSANTAGSTTETEGKKVLIKINTEGVGEIAVGEDGKEPEFDKDFPTQSAVFNVDPGAALAIVAKAGEGYQFSGWTKDGEQFSTEERIDISADADAEYVAVFGMSSGFDGEPVDDVKDAKTFADILALPSNESGSTDKYLFYTFQLNGIDYRAVSFIDQETADALFELDFDDPDHDKKYFEIVAPLTIDQMDNLTEMIPSKEEINAYVGKTGEDLLNEGWTYQWYNLDSMEFGMQHGLFTYNIQFDGKYEGNIDDFNEEEDIKPFVIKSIEYSGLGNTSADLEEQFFGE